MTIILLSIKPLYASQISSGQKRYEYQRKLPKAIPEKIIIYSSAPVKKVIGEAEVLGIISGGISENYEETKEFSGIGWEDYRGYFHGRSEAYAFRLGKFSPYNPPKNLRISGLREHRIFLRMLMKTLHINSKK